MGVLVGGTGVIVGVTSSAKTVEYVPLMIPTFEIMIGVCKADFGVGVGWLVKALCLPRVNMYWSAPPITTKNIGSAMRGTEIFRSKVVVCFLRISSNQCSSALNGLLMTTSGASRGSDLVVVFFGRLGEVCKSDFGKRGALVGSGGGLEIVGMGVEVVISVATVDAGSVPFLMKCPLASRGIAAALAFSFSAVAGETGIGSVWN